MEFDPVIHSDTLAYLGNGGEPFGETAIIGASGLLGSYLADFISGVNLASGNNSRVFAFSRSQTEHLQSLSSREGFSLFPISSLEEKATEMSNVHFIHAASPASSAKMNDKASLFETNFLMTQLILRSLENAGGRLTYFSSGEVYGDNPTVPTSEGDFGGFDHLGERGYYPEIKRFSELLIKSWSDQTHVPATILRIFHTFGPGLKEDDNRIFADAIRSAAAGKDIRLHSDGSARRSFLYTSDLAEAISVTMANERFDVFNVCGFPELSVLDFALLVAEQVEGCRVVRDDSADTGLIPQSPIRRGLADVTKLKSLGWSQKVSVKEAVSRTISSLRFRANPPGL